MHKPTKQTKYIIILLLRLFVFLTYFDFSDHYITQDRHLKHSAVKVIRDIFSRLSLNFYISPWNGEIKARSSLWALWQRNDRAKPKGNQEPSTECVLCDTETIIGEEDQCMFPEQKCFQQPAQKHLLPKPNFTLDIWTANTSDKVILVFVSYNKVPINKHKCASHF